MHILQVVTQNAETLVLKPPGIDRATDVGLHLIRPGTVIDRVKPARIMAVEILVPNAAIKNLIREDKVHQIYSMMQSGQARYGMMTMNQSLFNLYKRGEISQEIAVARSLMPEEIIQMFKNDQQSAQKRR